MDMRVELARSPRFSLPSLGILVLPVAWSWLVGRLKRSSAFTPDSS